MLVLRFVSSFLLLTSSLSFSCFVLLMLIKFLFLDILCFVCVVFEFGWFPLLVRRRRVLSCLFLRLLLLLLPVLLVFFLLRFAQHFSCGSLCVLLSSYSYFCRSLFGFLHFIVLVFLRLSYFSFGPSIYQYEDIRSPFTIRREVADGTLRPKVERVVGFPQQYTELMEQAWAQDPRDRPSFADCVTALTICEQMESRA